MAQLAPFWGYLGTLFGQFWVHFGLHGAILSHFGAFLGPRASKIAPAGFACAAGSGFWPILGSILGLKIGTFFDIFGVLFWTASWTTFGQVLGAILGSLLGLKRSQKVESFLERLLVAVWRHFGRLLGCLGVLLGGQVFQIYCKK